MDDLRLTGLTEFWVRTVPDSGAGEHFGLLPDYEPSRKRIILPYAVANKPLNLPIIRESAVYPANFEQF
jgi:hypothetical protein